MADESMGSGNVATVSASGSRRRNGRWTRSLAQIERNQGAVVVRTHAEGSTGVQHEHGRTVRSDPTQNLDRAH